MTSPLISILLPVANGAEFLFESLSSVLEQTYIHWECLVILNGPGLDGPAEAVVTALTAEDARVHILKVPHATNKVAALNAAVSHSKGDWIALLDVDDIWARTKLAEQVAVIPLGPAVIGTQARYFGEFQGQPALPTGWVSPSHLVTANPVINSSALMRREWAVFEYHPLYKDSMEDYYLWMKIALGGQVSVPVMGHGIYNISQILVSHRIHSTSAFNSRREDPAGLVAWYREKLVAEPVCTVITTACNNPGYIRAQHAALSRYVAPPWRFVVFNDAKDWPDATNFGDPTMRQQVEATCRELGIACVSVQNQAHRYMTSASHRHCDTLRHVMEFIRKSPPGRFWMWDSDMWPVAPYSARDLKARFDNATCVRQTREDSAGTEIVYAWPNLWWIDTAQTDIRTLCWDLAAHCDTGGASASWVKSCAPTWLPPHRSSCHWGAAELPTFPTLSPSVRHFLTADPRNQEGKYWAELYDDGRMFHVRAGSNWNGEGVVIHQQVADLVTSSFA